MSGLPTATGRRSPRASASSGAGAPGRERDFGPDIRLARGRWREPRGRRPGDHARSDPAGFRRPPTTPCSARRCRSPAACTSIFRLTAPYWGFWSRSRSPRRVGVVAHYGDRLRRVPESSSTCRRCGSSTSCSGSSCSSNVVGLRVVAQVQIVFSSVSSSHSLTFIVPGAAAIETANYTLFFPDYGGFGLAVVALFYRSSDSGY